MNNKIKFLIYTFVFAATTAATLVSFKIINKNKDVKNTLLEKFSKSSDTKEKVYKMHNTILNEQNIEKSTKLTKKEFVFRKEYEPILVSFATNYQKTRSFPPTISNFSFSNFWSSLSEVSKALFITFLAGAGSSVLGTIGYGIYKNVQNSRKEKLKALENASTSYKLTFTITKEDQKNKNWSVYAFGSNGFEDKMKVIGAFNDGNVENNKGDMTKDNQGNFIFTFSDVKDPKNVTVILKTSNSGDKTQSEPFTLGDFLEGWSKKNDSKLYFNEDYEKDNGAWKWKLKSGAEAIGTITVTKIM